MSHRLQITVPDDIAAALERLAQRSRESTSHAGARLLIAALDANTDDRPAAPTPARAADCDSRRSRPRWLEPYGDTGERRRWRREMWASVRALHERYPQALANLQHEWWLVPSRTELLCALTLWRADIDAAATDPRVALSFRSSSRASAGCSTTPKASAVESGHQAHRRSTGSKGTSAHRSPRPRDGVPGLAGLRLAVGPGGRAVAVIGDEPRR